MSEKLKNIFEDTRRQWSRHPRLYTATQEAAQKSICVDMDQYEPFLIDSEKRLGRITVVNERSFASCHNLKLGVTVLNFASATKPGGGVLNGSVAQEECLCRCSNLYYCLRQSRFMESFYLPHREIDALYDNRMILSPDVTVFKSDTEEPTLLPEQEWRKRTIISCAAPNLRRLGSIDEDILENILDKRIEGILDLAHLASTRTLVLGAFGSGVFQNPPELVSKIFYHHLVTMEKRYWFDGVIFAVLATSKKSEHNLRVYEKTFA